MEHMKKVMMILGLVVAGIALYMGVQHYHQQQAPVKTQGLNGIGIGIGGFGLGLGETENKNGEKRAVIGVPLFKTNSGQNKETANEVKVQSGARLSI